MSKETPKDSNFSYSDSVLDSLLDGLSGESGSSGNRPHHGTALPAGQPHNDEYISQIMEKFTANMDLGDLSDHEVLELLMSYSLPQGDMTKLSHKLLKIFGSFTGVINAPFAELCAVTGLGEQTAMYFRILMRLCARYNIEMQRTISVSNAQALYDYMLLQFASESDECAKLFLVDKQGKVSAPQEIGRGLESTSVFSFKKAMNIISGSSFSYILLAHNHLGDSSVPSDNDVVITRRFRQMIDPIGVALIDHFVIAGNSLSSMRKLGLLDL